MAYSEELAERVRDELGPRPGLSERKMFGGLAFMLWGHMACGILGDELMVRVGPDAYEKVLAEPHVRPMDFTGRPMKGMAFVEPGGLTGPGLRRWVERAAAYAESLPPK